MIDAMIDAVQIPEGSQGKWSVQRFVVSKSDSDMTALRAMMKGRGFVPPGNYTRLYCKGRGIVMSDTPDERRDYYEAVFKARDHVLINGLGIGMVLAAILKKAAVTKVTVVEIDPDVVALVSPTYLKDTRVQIVTADAFDYSPPKSERYGAVWHDIWDAICDDNLSEMTRLKRKYGQRTDWQGCWCEREYRR